MKKRILPIVLALLLSITALTGCGNGNGGTDDTNANSDTAAADNTVAASNNNSSANSGSLTKDALLAMEETAGTDFSVSETAGGVSIASYYGEAEIVVIPAQVNGKTVCRIDDYVFRSNKNLKAIVIPESVTSIGKEAFNLANKLEIVVFKGSGLTEIEENAFYSCESLKEIEIPETVTSIKESAFANCMLLAGITIPDGITSIAGGTFFMTAITEVTIPDSVTMIDSTAFAGCAQLTTCSIPGSVTEIAPTAFQGSNMVTIIAPAGSYAAQYAAEQNIKTAESNE